jgi:hypothetical protein
MASLSCPKDFPLTFHGSRGGKIAVMPEVWKFARAWGCPAKRLSSPASWHGGCLQAFFPVGQQFRSLLDFVNFSYQTSCFPPGVGTAASPSGRDVFHYGIDIRFFRACRLRHCRHGWCSLVLAIIDICGSVTDKWSLSTHTISTVRGRTACVV